MTGWLTARAKVSEELRETRVSLYPPVWKRTSMLSKYPRTDATYADLKHFHLDLRRWYYEIGGVALSQNGRDRFIELQKLAAAHLARDDASSQDQLKTEAYDGLETLASGLRTALTDDLESRRQRSTAVDARPLAATTASSAGRRRSGRTPSSGRPHASPIRYELTA